MNNREITALIHENESRDNLAKALKSGKAAKELREAHEALEKERKALERSHGGVKRLAAADAYYESRIAEANDDARVIGSEVEGLRKAWREEVVVKEQTLAEAISGIDNHKHFAAMKAQELENAALAVKAREKKADTREAELDRLASELGTRETNVVAREAEAVKFDNWAAGRP